MAEEKLGWQASARTALHTDLLQGAHRIEGHALFDDLCVIEAIPIDEWEFEGAIQRLNRTKGPRVGASRCQSDRHDLTVSDDFVDGVTETRARGVKRVAVLLRGLPIHGRHTRKM